MRVSEKVNDDDFVICANIQRKMKTRMWSAQIILILNTAIKGVVLSIHSYKQFYVVQIRIYRS